MYRVQSLILLSFLTFFYHIVFIQTHHIVYYVNNVLALDYFDDSISYVLCVQFYSLICLA